MTATVESALLAIESLLAARRYKEALAASSDGIQHFPTYAEFYYHRAQARTLSENPPDLVGAIDDATTALNLNNQEPAYAFFRGLWRIETSDWVGAAEDFALAITLENKLGSVYYMDSSKFLRVLALKNMGDHVAAQRELQSVPEDASFYVRSRLWHKKDL